MLSAAERLIPPTEAAPEAAPPPGLAAFYWHFIRQARGPFAAMFAAVGVVAVLDTLVRRGMSAPPRVEQTLHRQILRFPELLTGIGRCQVIIKNPNQELK